MSYARPSLDSLLDLLTPGFVSAEPNFPTNSGTISVDVNKEATYIRHLQQELQGSLPETELMCFSQRGGFEGIGCVSATLNLIHSLKRAAMAILPETSGHHGDIKTQCSFVMHALHKQ